MSDWIKYKADRGANLVLQAFQVFGGESEVDSSCIFDRTIIPSRRTKSKIFLLWFDLHARYSVAVAYVGMK